MTGPHRRPAPQHILLPVAVFRCCPVRHVQQPGFNMWSNLENLWYNLFVLRAQAFPAPDWSDLDGFILFAKTRQEKILQSLPSPPAGVKETEISYPARDGVNLRAILYQPTRIPAGGSPLVLLFHGGGFCIGLPEGEAETARNLVRAYSAVCVSASYRLAPEFPYPYAANDAWDALKWVASNADDLGANPAAMGFIVGGSSAGANLSAIVTHIARDTALQPPLTGQFLACPMVCGGRAMPPIYHDKYSSWVENSDAPIMPVQAIDMLMSGYKPDDADGERFAILKHPNGHANIPPVYIVVSGLDPLRDHGIIYEQVLREDFGIKTKLDVYPGVPHAHWAFLPMLSQSRKFRKNQIRAFGWLLGSEPLVVDDTKEPFETMA
ncbi:Alpha/Beta hydrolase protein [Aspergillus californicus]